MNYNTITTPTNKVVDIRSLEGANTLLHYLKVSQDGGGCGHCRKSGHNRRTCPELKQAAATLDITFSNQRLVDIFIELAKATYFNEPVHGLSKSIAYRRAATIFSTIQTKITAETLLEMGPSGANKTEGIGNAIVQKAIEFLTTGRISKLNEYLLAASQGTSTLSTQAVQGITNDELVALPAPLIVDGIITLETMLESGTFSAAAAVQIAPEDTFNYNIDESIADGEHPILKLYMENFIRLFLAKDDRCYFWAFKIIDLSSPPTPASKIKKIKPLQIVDLSLQSTTIPTPVSGSPGILLPPVANWDTLIYEKKGLMKIRGGFCGSITYHGFNTNDIKSCLQKYIRRGETDKAIRALLELDRFYILRRAEAIKKSKLAADGSIPTSVKLGLRTNMVNRLRILSCEDFGESNIHLIVKVDEYLTLWEKHRCSNFIESQRAIMELISIFEQVPKSRMMSYIRAAYKTAVSSTELRQKYNILYNQAFPNTHTMPAIKKQKKIKGQRRKKTTCVGWNNKSCEYILWDFIKRYSSSNLTTLEQRTVLINYKWFKGATQKEYWIFLIQAIKISMQKFNGTSRIQPLAAVIKTDSEIRHEIVSHLVKPIILDDYCFDQHTKRGRANGRSHVYFSETGADVVNESESVIHLYKDIYNDLKILAENKGRTGPPVAIDKTLDDVHIAQWSAYLSSTGVVAHYIEEVVAGLPISHPCMVDPSIEDIGDDELHYILALPRGQQLTSTNKRSVYIGADLVYKGPFKSIGDVKFANNIKFTKALCILESVSTVPDKYKTCLQFKFKRYKSAVGSYYFIVYKNVGNISATEPTKNVPRALISKTIKELMPELNGIDRESIEIYDRGVIKRISDLIGTQYSDLLTSDIKLATLQHLYIRYLLDIGDSGTQNVLFREDGGEQLVVGVDMEESRTKDQGETKLEFLFNKFSKPVYRTFKDSIQGVVRLTDAQIDEISHLLIELGFDCDRIKGKIAMYEAAADSRSPPVKKKKKEKA